MTEPFTNRLGLGITLVEVGTAATDVTVDGRTLRLMAPYEQLAVGIARWNKGAYLQDALGFLSADEREFLLTGTTPDEWNTMFPPEEEDL